MTLVAGIQAGLTEILTGNQNPGVVLQVLNSDRGSKIAMAIRLVGESKATPEEKEQIIKNMLDAAVRGYQVGEIALRLNEQLNPTGTLKSRVANGLIKGVETTSKVIFAGGMFKLGMTLAASHPILFAGTTVCTVGTYLYIRLWVRA